MQKRLALVLCLVLLCFVCDSLADGLPSTTAELEAAYEAMSVTELREAQSALETVLNQKLVQSATLQFSSAEIKLALNKTFQPEMICDGREITSSTTLSYTSSNPDVASVSSGMITATGAGTASIIASATFEDGGKLSAQCKVSVFVPVKAITLTSKSVCVLVGNTLACNELVCFSPENATEKELTYSVSDEEIASIDIDGTLTAKQAGKVSVIISSADAAEKPKSSTLKVSVLQPVEKIDLTESSCNVSNGGKHQLSYTLKPDNASNTKVIWTSSNPAIAKVSPKGLVTGAGTGTATITCTSADGSEISASVEVTVITPVKKVSLPGKTISLTEGSETILSAQIFPENATNRTLQWSCSSSSIASVNQNGKVTAKQPGKCTLSVKAADGSGAMASITVYVEPKLPIYVKSIHWQTTWGMKNGRMGVIAENLCVNRKIKAFDYTVVCYSYYNSDPVTERLTYAGPVISPGKSGKSTLTPYSVGGFTNAYRVEITPTKVYFSDGTSETIPKQEQYTSTFSM